MRGDAKFLHEHESPLDRLDHRLLALLQADSGQTLEALGDAIGLSPSAVQRRIARYRADRLLLRQVAVLDPGRFDGVVLATVFVTLEQESVALHRAFQERMRAAPEVQQCYDLAGSRGLSGDPRGHRHAGVPATSSTGCS